MSSEEKEYNCRSKRKRSNDNLSDKEDEDLANCLVMLSNSGTIDGRAKSVNKGKTRSGFECKACKKVFASHQALGGHRASHKKVKGCFASEDKEEQEDDEDEDEDQEEEVEEKSTVQMARKRSNGHECTICHRVFASGQALGGHKRCHWLTPPSYGRDSRKPAVRKCEPSDRRSIDLNLACPESSVDRTDRNEEQNNMCKLSEVINSGSSSWLQLASGDWF